MNLNPLTWKYPLADTTLVSKQTRQTICLLAMFLILLIPNLVYAFQAFSFHRCIFYFLPNVCILAGVFCILLCCFSVRCTFGLLALPLLIQVPLECGHLIWLRDFFLLNSLISVLKTDRQEAAQFSGSLIPYYIGIAVVLVLYVFLAASASLQIPAKIKHRLKFISLFLFLLAFVALAIFPYCTDYLKYSNRNRYAYTLRRCVLKTYPINLPYRLYEYGVMARRIKLYGAEQQAFMFDCERSTKTGAEIYVFVIGEGMRSGNLHLNGYERQTTPNLDQVKNLVSFSKMYSNANVTYTAFPQLMTRATPHDFERAYREKTVFTLFRQAGFTTYWISNNNVRYMCNLDEIDFPFDLYGEGRTDLAVLPPFEKVVQDSTREKKFIVINMRGVHTEPSGFPDRFNKFKPNTADNYCSLNPVNKASFVNQYDNMILLEDFVLSRLISVLQTQNTSAFVLFTSDHAFNLFDDAENLYGYGSAGLHKREVHIPLLIWLSDSFAADSPSKCLQISRRKGEYCCTTNVFYTLGELAGIRGGYLQPKYSLCNEQYAIGSVHTVLCGDEVKTMPIPQD